MSYASAANVSPSQSIPVDNPAGVHAELREHHGAITVFINGEPWPLVSFKATELPDEELFRTTVQSTLPELAKRNVNLIFVPVRFNWSGPDEYDFSPMEQRLRWVLDAHPQARLIVRVQAWCMQPEWWMQANPEAVLHFGNMPGPRMKKPDHQTEAAPSLASDFWDSAGLPALSAIAGYLRAQDYSQQIVGYLPTALNTNEWFLRSYHDQEVNDFCPAMQVAFGKYLRDEYGIEPGPKPVPPRAARGYGDFGQYLAEHPKDSHTTATAYYRFVNKLCADTILKITRTLRQAHEPDRIIVGTFYGYSHGLANHYWLPDSGHLALHRLLGSEGPDFTCSPLEYFTRNSREPGFGGLTWAQGTAPDSGRLAGKGYYGEDDFSPSQGDAAMGWTSAGTPEEDAEQLRRNFAFALCKGQLLWWYDLHGHWYEGKMRLNVVEQCTRIAHQATQRDREGVAQCAFIMDEEASTHLTLDRENQRAVCWSSFYETAAHIGAPVDQYLLSDWERIPWHQYKIIFFPNSYCLTAQQRAKIHELKQGGRILVFTGGPGLIDPQDATAFDLDRLGEITGMHIVETPTVCQQRLTFDCNLTGWESFGDQTFGVHQEMPVTFCVDDPQVEALAYYSGRGPVGLARRAFENWTCYYCSVPGLPGSFARTLLKEAKVHCYLDSDDVLYANKSYIAVHVRHGGMKTLHLPYAMKLVELFHDSSLEQVAECGYTWEAKSWHTYLFRCD